MFKLAPLVILPAILFSTSCNKSESAKHQSASPDPTGYFTVKGTAPKELSEIDWFAINPESHLPETAPDSNWGSKFPHGCLRLKNGTRIKYDHFHLHGNTIEICTAPYKGTTYTLTGRFGPEKAFDEMQKDLSALSGTLTKTSASSSSQFNVEFYWFCGD